MAPKRKVEKKVQEKAEESLKVSDPLTLKPVSKIYMDVALLRAEAVVGLNELEKKKVRQVARMQLELKLIEHASRGGCRLGAKRIFSKERLKDLNLLCSKMEKGKVSEVLDYMQVEEQLVQEEYRRQEAVNSRIEEENADSLIGEEEGDVF